MLKVREKHSFLFAKEFCWHVTTSLPSVWFDKDNQNGFIGTRSWFQEIKAIRESLPNYKQEIKALAEAVLEFSDEPSIKNYQYWRQYFIDKGTPGLLNLFQITAIQQLCN